MVKIKGVNVFPRQIEGVLQEFPQLSSEYQIRISHLEGRDTMRIYVETDGTQDFLDLADEVAHEVSAASASRRSSRWSSSASCRAARRRPSASSTSATSRGARPYRLHSPSGPHALLAGANERGRLPFSLALIGRTARPSRPHS